MTTKVCFESKYQNMCYFETFDGYDLHVKSFEDGIATLEVVMGYEISSFLEVVVGCFDKHSNFTRELIYAYNCDKDTVLKGIKFEFNTIPILVTKANADVDKIYAEYYAKRKANPIKLW